MRTMILIALLSSAFCWLLSYADESMPVNSIDSLDMDIQIPDSLQEDNSWIADSLNLDNLDIDTLTFDEWNPKDYFSFFPHIDKAETFKGFYFNSNIGAFNHAENVIPSGFFKAKYPFNGSTNLEDDMLKVNSGFIENKTESPISSSFFEIGFSSIYTTPYMFPLQLDLGIIDVNSVLYSINEDKRFVDHEGITRTVKEANIIELKEYLFNARFMAELPIWGMAVSPGGTAAATYYYFLLGLQGQYAFHSKASQFYQLVSEDTRIRYENGNDRKYLIEDQNISEVNRIRSHYVFGFGINIIAKPVFANLNLLYHLPFNSIIDGTNWNHQYFSLQLKLAFSS